MHVPTRHCRRRRRRRRRRCDGDTWPSCSQHCPRPKCSVGISASLAQISSCRQTRLRLWLWLRLRLWLRLQEEAAARLMLLIVPAQRLRTAASHRSPMCTCRHAHGCIHMQQNVQQMCVASRVSCLCACLFQVAVLCSPSVTKRTEVSCNVIANFHVLVKEQLSTGC